MEQFLLEISRGGRSVAVQESMHKAFISYYHAADQVYKNNLVDFSTRHGVFIDGSVDSGDIDDALPDESIRQIIRDDYLRDTTVTIVLVSPQTRERKHVDWEIYSSMFDGARNKRSGVLAIMLPSTGSTFFTAAHDGEKDTVYPDCQEWVTIADRAEYERRYPGLPDRLVDNLLKNGAKVSVTNWNRIVTDPERLRFLIEAAHRDRASCDYDLARPLRRANS